MQPILPKQKTIRWVDPKDRGTRAPRVTQRRWEQYRDQIQRMYVEEGKKLEDIMEVMKDEHSFAPSKHQYTAQFYTKWAFYKYRRAHRSQNHASRPNGQISTREDQNEGLDSATHPTQIARSNDDTMHLDASRPSVQLESEVLKLPALDDSVQGSASGVDTDMPDDSDPAALQKASPSGFEDCVEAENRASPFANDEFCPLSDTLQDLDYMAVTTPLMENMHLDGSIGSDGSCEEIANQETEMDDNEIMHFGHGIGVGMHDWDPVLRWRLDLSDVADTIERAIQDISGEEMASATYKQQPWHLIDQAQRTPILCQSTPVAKKRVLDLSKTLLSSAGSCLSGLASMIALRERIEQNGRLYQIFGHTKYWAPDDESVQELQDLNHVLWTLSMENKLYLAPIEDPKSVLDIGTGTGVWAIEVAEKFPEALVEGVDISPIQPQCVPPNVVFWQDDFSDDWLRGYDYLVACDEDEDWPRGPTRDLIHARELLGTVSDWDVMYRQIYQALKPGGWIDHAEPSLLFFSDHVSFNDDHPFCVWNKVIMHAGREAGLEFDTGEHIKDRLINAGFMNVRGIRMKWPIGQWPMAKDLKKIGAYNLFRIQEGIRGFCAELLTEQMGWTSEEIDTFCGKLKAALKEKKNYIYNCVYFGFGQRPHAPEIEEE